MSNEKFREVARKIEPNFAATYPSDATSSEAGNGSGEGEASGGGGGGEEGLLHRELEKEIQEQHDDEVCVCN